MLGGFSESGLRMSHDIRASEQRGVKVREQILDNLWEECSMQGEQKVQQP
jgi:hypothetical protein